MVERPVSKEDFRSAAQQMADAMEAGAPVTELVVGEQTFEIRRREGGLTVSDADGEATSEAFAPSELKPPYNLPSPAAFSNGA